MFPIWQIFKFLLKPEAVFITLSIVALALIVKFANTPQLTYDSWDYIHASESATIYFSGRNTDGHTYLYRPPALPLYLHFFQDQVNAVKWLNAICYILSLWICFFITRELKFERTFSALFIILVACSYPWLQNHFFVWSEPPFSAFLLLLVWILIKEKSWIWITILLVILFFIRKAGTFICFGTILVVLAQREYKKSILIGSVLFPIIVSWELLSSSYSDVSPSQKIFSDLVIQSRWFYADAFSAWFLPENINLLIRLGILFLLIFIAAFFRKDVLIQLATGKKIKTIIILTATYLTFILLLTGASEFSEADRYLSVMLPLTMLIFMAAIRSVYLQASNKKYFLILLILWMMYPVIRTLHHLI
jgi:hypothetical protein